MSLDEIRLKIDEIDRELIPAPYRAKERDE